jgi:RNA polymerase sigma-70 factor (ECF subfamily)
MASTSNSRDAIRLAADGLQGENAGRFRRRSVGSAAGVNEELVRSAVDRAREGDVEALRFLYLRYADVVFSYVCSIVSDEHTAEDITQIVFSRLATRLQRYKANEAPFGAWITRVAYNASIDYLRAQRTVPCEEVRHPDVSREDVAPDRLEALRVGLAALPEDQRAVLVLRFVLGLSADEIGKRLGRSEPAVHALQHKGRRRMREELVRLEAAPTVRAAA